MVIVKKSCCWKFYDTSEKKGHAKCKICRKTVKYISSTNLLRHLRNKHKEELEDYNKTGTFKIPDPVSEPEENSDDEEQEIVVKVNRQSYSSNIEKESETSSNKEEENMDQESVNEAIEHELENETTEEFVTDSNQQTLVILQPETMTDIEAEAFRQKISEVVASANSHLNENNTIAKVNKKKAKSKESSTSDSFHPIVTGVTGSLDRVPAPEDHFDMFGKYVASILRSIPSTKTTSKLQSVIVTMCLQEKLRFCKNK